MSHSPAIGVLHFVSKCAVDPRRRQDTDRSASGRMREMRWHSNTSRNTDQYRPYTGPPQSINVAEHVASCKLVTESFKRDPDGIYKVLQYITPRQQSNRRLMLGH